MEGGVKIISIHALVKRATVTHAQLALGVVISIHALVKRATMPARTLWTRSKNFNPRPRKEGDVIQVRLSEALTISIHALVKRATANLYNDYLYFEAKYHISDIFPL